MCEKERREEQIFHLCKPLFSFTAFLGEQSLFVGYCLSRSKLTLEFIYSAQFNPNQCFLNSNSSMALAKPEILTQ